MVFDISVAMTWILFLALFPISFVWLRRAWRIVMYRDFSEVAIKRGEAPPNPEKFAPYEMAINLVAGTVIVCVICFFSASLIASFLIISVCVCSNFLILEYSLSITNQKKIMLK